MNHMKKQDRSLKLKQLRALSESVGDFIRYWGFRRIHGSIWTQIYLSPRPLSGTELKTRLNVSKALVSPALAEMEKWGLILPAPSKNSKTKSYTAAPDVFSVVRQVLATREQPMVAKVAHQLKIVADCAGEELHAERFANLQSMVKSAQFGLEILLQVDDFFDLAEILKIGDEA